MWGRGVRARRELRDRRPWSARATAPRPAFGNRGRADADDPSTAVPMSGLRRRDLRRAATDPRATTLHRGRDRRRALHVRQARRERGRSRDADRLVGARPERVARASALDRGDRCRDSLPVRARLADGVESAATRRARGDDGRRARSRDVRRRRDRARVRGGGAHLMRASPIPLSRQIRPPRWADSMPARP